MLLLGPQYKTQLMKGKQTRATQHMCAPYESTCKYVTYSGHVSLCAYVFLLSSKSDFPLSACSRERESVYVR